MPNHQLKYNTYRANVKCLEKGGEKTMIILCWRREYARELDKHRLAKAIGRIIPLIVEWHKAMRAISKNIEVETRLILK